MAPSPPPLPRMAGPAPAPQVPVISTGAGLQNFAKGLSDFAKAIGDDQANRDTLKRIEFEQRFETEAAAKAATLDPMEVDYETKVVEAYREAGAGITEAAADQFHSQVPLLQMRANIEQAVGTAQRAAIGARHKAVEAVAEAQYSTTAQATLAQIRKDPDGEDVYLAQFQPKAAEIGAALPGVKTAALALSFAQDAIIAKAEGLSLQGRNDEARAYLGAHNDALTDAARRGAGRLINEIESDQERKFLAATEAMVAQHRTAIDESPTVAALEEQRRQLDAQEAAGLFQHQPQVYAQLRAAMETRRGQIVTASRDLVTGLNNYRNGVGLDDQKQADAVWASISGVLPQGAPLGARLALLSDFVNRGGRVPTEYRRVLENSDRVNDPALLASAAQLYDGLHKAGAPDAVFADIFKDGSRALLVSGLVADTGMLYDDAAALVNERVPDNATLAHRREQYKADFKVGYDFAAELRKAIPGAKAFLGIGTSAQVDPALAVDYERSVRAFYDVFGERRAALGAANRYFASRYGVTGTAGGQERIVKYPAEQFFPGVYNKPDVLSDAQKRTILDGDVRRVMGAYGVVPATVVGDGEDASGTPDFDLHADPVTEAEIVNGLRPSYELRARNNMGQLVPIIVERDDGATVRLRYTMPDAARLTATPEYAAIIAQANADAARAVAPSLLRKGLEENVPPALNAVRDAVRPTIQRMDQTIGPYQKPPGYVGPRDLFKSPATAPLTKSTSKVTK